MNIFLFRSNIPTQFEHLPISPSSTGLSFLFAGDDVSAQGARLAVEDFPDSQVLSDEEIDVILHRQIFRASDPIKERNM